MATSLDKLENKVQIHHLHVECFHVVKYCENPSSMSGDIQQNTPVFWPCRSWRSQMSSIISGDTQHKFTKFLHDVATSSPLLTCTSRQWYCRSFASNSSKMQVVSIGVHDILPKSIDCHGNVPWHIGKRGSALSSALKALSYGGKIVKIGRVYSEIFD